MRSKTPLALMEQLVMVLVFALAAAICLQVFALSDRLSRKHEAVSQAALQSQNTAELLKSSGSAWEQVLEERAWEKKEDVWYLAYDEDWQTAAEEDDWSYRMEIRQAKTEVSGLQRVEIQVIGAGLGENGGEAVLFQIPAAWQEVDGHE